MAFNIAIVKKHPVAAGAIIVVGGLLLFLMLRGGSGGSVAAGATGPTDAQIQAALAQQGMQFQAGMAAQNYQFQLAAQSADIQGQLALGQLSLTAQQKMIEASLVQLGAQTELAKYQTDIAFAAQKDSNATALAGQQAVLQSTYNLAALNAATQTHQADLSAQVHMFDTAAFTDLQKLITQSNASVMITQSNNQVQMHAIDADTQKYLAKKQGQSSMFGSLLGFAGTALSLFSDIRVKGGVQPTGAYLDDGTPLHEFRYLGIGPKQYGVIAQDVEIRRPDLVDKVAGVRRVRYDLLAAA